MPRYLVERNLATGLGTLLTADSIAAVVEANTECGVHWLHSYIEEPHQRMLCLYEAASPEAVRRASRRAGLPIDEIRQVRALDPSAIALVSATART